MPVAAQKLPADLVFRIVSRVAQRAQVTFAGVSTGFSVGSIDLGSNNVRTMPEGAAAPTAAEEAE